MNTLFLGVTRAHSLVLAVFNPSRFSALQVSLT
jgi:hypothetical protein